MVEYFQPGCTYYINGFLKYPSGFYPRKKGEYYCHLEEWLCLEIIGNIFENEELMER